MTPITLEFRPLSVTVDGSLIFISRSNGAFIAVKQEELDELIGKLSALRA